MKILVLAFFVSFVLLPFAKAESILNWSELEAQMKVKLVAPLSVLDFHLPESTRFNVTDSSTLDDLNVQVIDAHFEPCPNEMGSRQMDLQMVDQNYGMELHQGCNVSIYLELKDFYRPSYFETLTP
jgi:hypothetical protein